jgi:hypothetical protein
VNDGIAELSAGVVQVSGIVCETWATGKTAVRNQKYQQVAIILMKSKQNINPNEAVHRGTKLLYFSRKKRHQMQPTKE